MTFLPFSSAREMCPPPLVIAEKRGATSPSFNFNSSFVAMRFQFHQRSLQKPIFENLWWKDCYALLVDTRSCRTDARRTDFVEVSVAVPHVGSSVVSPPK